MAKVSIQLFYNRDAQFLNVRYGFELTRDVQFLNGRYGFELTRDVQFFNGRYCFELTFLMLKFYFDLD